MTSTHQSPILTSGESTHWGRYRLDCAALSAAGAGRAQNEDHCVFAGPGDTIAEAAGAGFVFAAIDGNPVGGHARSAARETGSSLLEILDDPRRESLRPDLLMHRLHDANDRCHRFIEGRAAVTAVWVWEDDVASSMTVSWAHVGDTRLYHHGRSGWNRVTRDHAKGRLLDRAIGQGDGLQIDTGERSLGHEERLVLVSRGVWAAANPRSVLPRAPFPATAECARRLVGQARLNGSREDTTAIVITVRDVDAGPEPEH